MPAPFFRSSLLSASAALLLLATPSARADVPAGMVEVPAGVYRPLIRGEKDPKEVPVPSFSIELMPVTNADFLEFVRAKPQWRRSQVKRIFADTGYLQHWAGDLDFGPPENRLSPVVFVSWFAAKAYAVWKGGRLPTTAEWEYVANVGFVSIDGAKEPDFMRAIATWYSSPAPDTLPPAGAGRSNLLGIHDLHGLVWEWTSDFNSTFVSGDARGDTGLDRQFFCGAGSLGASDRTNYPAFMRFGFRSSLKAAYTVHNLGFRCARNL